MVFLTTVSLVIAGLLLGFIFPRLLKELDIDVSKEHAILSVVGFAFIVFVAFMLYPLFAFGSFQINDISSFYGTDYFWLVVAILVGGFANFVLQRIRK
jgi:hypothetical protein